MAGGSRSIGRGGNREAGQVLVLFCLSMVAMLVALALLYDGARALVLRRQLQNVADAAALAGANVISSGTTPGCLSSGVIRPAVATAAKDSVKTNLGWSDATVASKVIVSCPTDEWLRNLAVTVAINDTAPTYFGRVAGSSDLAVGASGTAVNGSLPPGRFSVVELDPGPPWTAGWPNGYQGCPSIGFQGNMAVLFEGSIHTNSACLASSNPPGAIGINGGGSSVSITLVSPAVVQMVGTWSPGPLAISPTPITNAQPVEDPLGDLPVMPTLATATTSGNPRTTIGNGLNPECSILEPGTYPGGIDIKAQGSAWLRPGMYVIAGGGITLGAQGAIYSLSGDTNITNCGALDSANWDTALCRVNECGVLIYNTSGTGGAFAAMGPLDLGGGAGVKLRAYVPSIDPMSTRQPAYKNLMFWQSVSPVPDQNYRQPELSLRGGGTAYLQGTVYAPSARVNLGGNCGGEGGEPLDLTLQFISWDLFIAGSCTFNFLYSVEGFTDFPVYGLIK